MGVDIRFRNAGDLIFRWGMQVPTHGGKIDIALLSEAVAHIQHRNILSLEVVERFEGQHGIFGLC